MGFGETLRHSKFSNAQSFRSPAREQANITLKCQYLLTAFGSYNGREIQIYAGVVVTNAYVAVVRHEPTSVHVRC